MCIISSSCKHLSKQARPWNLCLHGLSVEGVLRHCTFLYLARLQITKSRVLQTEYLLRIVGVVVLVLGIAKLFQCLSTELSGVDCPLRYERNGVFTLHLWVHFAKALKIATLNYGGKKKSLIKTKVKSNSLFVALHLFLILYAFIITDAICNYCYLLQQSALVAVLSNHYC